MPSAYDIKKAKERAEADAKKYASVDTAKQGQHHTSNYQGMALRRKQKMESETGIFDIHGRRVQPQRPKKPYYLANFQPKITLLSQQEEQLKHQQQLERSQRRAVQKEKERRRSLTDNIKGNVGIDDDRLRCILLQATQATKTTNLLFCCGQCIFVSLLTVQPTALSLILVFVLTPQNRCLGQRLRHQECVKNRRSPVLQIHPDVKIRHTTFNRREINGESLGQ